MTVTAILIALIISVSCGVSAWINHREEERSFERLYEEAGGIADEIEYNMKNDREELEMIAAVVASYNDLGSKELWSLLDSYTTIGMMSRVEMLLPDNTVITKGGQRIDAEGRLSFSEEASLREHISDRETDLTGDEEYIVRHYVPVRKDNETIAMLYGVIELGTLPDSIANKPHDGDAAIYVIDGETGDFLVDTWHPGETGNIWALGERKMAPGYDQKQLEQGLIDGKDGYVVFVSASIGEYLYFCYKPMNINQWRIALSVPEDVVFQNADEIKGALNYAFIFEIICFILYFLWISRYFRSVTDEKQRKLETINYMYDVENLLFNAHEKQENIVTALEKIAHILSAERVCFWMVGRSREEKRFIWQRDEGAADQDLSTRKEKIYRLLEYFGQGNNEFAAYSPEEIERKLPGNSQGMMENIIAVPVKDLEGRICGILIGCNMDRNKADTAFLESVKFSFSMFCQNLDTLNAVREYGERDALTGLYNRNKYEEDLPKVQGCYEHSLACVYIDVNGLHELNNTKGHEAGDRMLKTVSRKIRDRFGEEYAYRIGGDEFVVFVPDQPEEVSGRLAEELIGFLKEDGYYISVGIAWEENGAVDGLIKTAEKKMYIEKKKFYEQAVNDRRGKSRL